MRYPLVRLRRLRSNPRLRELVNEERLLPTDLIQPVFVKEGIAASRPIASMPGQFQCSEKDILRSVQKTLDAGVNSILLFGIPKIKDRTGTHAYAAQGLVPRVIRRLKKEFPELLLIADVCLCEYLIHGHCGHLKNGRVINDSSVSVLAKIALVYAEAGADIVAPSDMMDGRVLAIRTLLDKKGHEAVPILSYAVKYASAFYAPFRDAAENAPATGDRAGYQMNPANRREAVREAETDLGEGADMLMVKPALGYMDIVHDLKGRFSCPIGCYSVSGEYAMIKAAGEKGWLDEKKIVMETHLGFKRSGADFIVTYWASELARWIKR